MAPSEEARGREWPAASEAAFRASPREEGERAQLLNRLRRIEGQIKGLQRMVEEERYCMDILGQIASAQEALRGVGKQLLRSHLRDCVTEAIRSGDDKQAERAYEELLDAAFRYSR